MNNTLQEGCGHDAPALEIDQALSRMRDELQPIAGRQHVPVRQALGRVLAGSLVSPLDVPSADNSAMDGYALRAADLREGGRLRVVGDAYAGHPYLGTLGPGQCVRIMTGAVVPEGADTVAMQEHVTRDGESVRVERELRRGEHVRLRGEDISRGSQLMGPGHRVTAADLGVLASLGFAEVAVRRRLRVAFFSTGDELRSLGQPLGPGEIYDSNRYSLHGLLTRFGADLLDLGVIPDRMDALEAALDQAAADADVVITSGGVSVGDADHVREALQRRGRMAFWSVNIKPGRPLAFGRLGRAAFFGLPGNPVSVVVTFCQLVQPALRHLEGAATCPRLRFPAVAASAFRKKAGRAEFPRGILEPGGDGAWRVRSAGAQGAGVLRSLSEGDCFVVLDPDRGPVGEGEPVLVEPFRGNEWATL